MKEQITPARILGISASLRDASLSTFLIRLLAQRAGAEIVIYPIEISGIPL
jgi:NAD(P)H-dependent FMN reductase